MHACSKVIHNYYVGNTNAHLDIIEGWAELFIFKFHFLSSFFFSPRIQRKSNQFNREGSIFGEGEIDPETGAMDDSNSCSRQQSQAPSPMNIQDGTEPPLMNNHDDGHTNSTTNHVNSTNHMEPITSELTNAGATNHVNHQDSALTSGNPSPMNNDSSPVLHTLEAAAAAASRSLPPSPPSSHRSEDSGTVACKKARTSDDSADDTDATETREVEATSELQSEAAPDTASVSTVYKMC